MNTIIYIFNYLWQQISKKKKKTPNYTVDNSPIKIY